DLAASVDDRADARRRGADHRQALLGGTKARLREMLRRAPAAEPGVVRRVEDEGRAVLPVDDMAGENDLVAELQSDLAPILAEPDRPRSRPGREIDVAGCEARQADGGEEGPHRQIFAVGHEMRLVVAAEDAALRTER